VSEPSPDDLLALTYQHYPDRRDEARAACERLLRTPFLPAHIDATARANSTWYADPIGLLGNDRFREPPYVAGKEITFPVPDGWSRFNPSIALNWVGDAEIIVRSANYHIERSGVYTIHDTDGVIRTENYLGRVCLDTLEAFDFTRIDDARIARDRADYLVQGLEDCRLFFVDMGRFVSATVRDRHPDGIAQMVMAGVRENTIIEWQILSDRTQHEKNWMPIVGGWEPQWLYSCSPTMVRWPDGDGTWAPAPWVARHFRGGSQVIPVDGTYLCLIHESVTFEAIPHKVYTHRWVELSPHYRITRVSAPFTFQGRGIEFAAGLVRQGDDLIVSYGVNDAKAWLLRIPLAQVLESLEDAA